MTTDSWRTTGIRVTLSDVKLTTALGLSTRWLARRGGEKY